MAGGAGIYPRSRMARPANERRSMVTAHSAPKLFARSVVINALGVIAGLCAALVGSPVWRAVRLAARLALPPRFRRPERASVDRGSSARYGAVTATSDRTQHRSLRVSTERVSPPLAVHDAHRVEHLPDVAWPITYRQLKTRHIGTHRPPTRRAGASTLTLSHGRTTAEESPRWRLSAEPLEARNSHQ